MIDGGLIFVDLFFGVVIFGGIGGIVWKVRREDVDDVTDMRSVALVRIADAGDEQMVRVAGRVVPGEGGLVKAPVSGRPCVAWQLRLTAGWSLGRDRIVESDLCVGFVLDDGSGPARVGYKVAVWALARRVEGAGSGDDVPATLAAWLAENHASDDWRDARRLRWSETRVEPGDEVAVVGIAHVGVDGDGEAATYRDVPKSVTIEGSDDAPLSLSDDPSLRSRPS